MQPKFGTTLICCGMKKDELGRLNLLGVFSPDMVALKLHEKQNYVLFMEVHGLDSGIHPIRVEIIEPGNAGNGLFEGGAKVTLAGHPWLFCHPIPFTLTALGTLKAFATIDGGKRQKVLELPVIAPETMQRIRRTN